MDLLNTSLPRPDSVVSIGRLTAFYVVLVPMELIPSKPPHGTYVIVSFCTLQKGSNFFSKYKKFQNFFVDVTAIWLFLMRTTFAFFRPGLSLHNPIQFQNLLDINDPL